MFKFFKICGFFCCLLFILFQPSFAEDITITTYYPSPYGNYRELRAARVAIGANYVDGAAYTWENVDGDGGEVDVNADLIVEDNVGIGTPTPFEKLHVEGGNLALRNGRLGIDPSSIWLGVVPPQNPITIARGGAPYQNRTVNEFIQFYSGTGNINQMMFGGTNAAFAIRYNGTSGSWDQRRLSVVTGVGVGDGSGGTEAFTVANNGNVGIGTTIPTAPLEVHTIAGTGTSIVSLGDIRLGEWGNDLAGSIYFENFPRGRITCTDNTPASIPYGVAPFADKLLIESGGSMALRSTGVGGQISFYYGLTETGRMTDDLFTYTGSMAIGTTTPRARLTVNGGIRANKGNPTPANNGANVGYAFEEDGDTGMFAVGGNAHTGSDLIFKIDTVERMRITNALGNVGIGTNSPGYKLHVIGDIYASGSVTWASDIKFKKNITDIDNALDKILKAKGVSFEWKTDEYKNNEFPEGRHYGVIAQEIEKVFPEIVKNGSNGEKSVVYTELIPVLIEAVKAQEKEIQALKQEVDNLKKGNKAGES